MSGIGKRLSNFRQNQTVLYNEIAPNVIPSRAVDQGLRVPTNIGGAISSYDPYNKRIQNEHPNISKYFVPVQTTDPDIRAQQEFCANSTLDQLINTQNPRAPTCGWLYKAPPTDSSPFPRYSKGVLSVAGNTPPPPIFNRPEGTTLYTDLREAKKIIEIDTCRALKSCSDVDNAPYKGMCGFSLWKGYGIPVNSDGTAKYNDERYYTPAAQIVTSASKCPVPQEDDEETTLSDEANVCKQLPNKSLSRDCMLQQIRNAGCDNKGSLYQSLAASTNPDNYASKLQGTLAYTEYQKRAMTANKPILSEILLRSGAGTQADALNNFNGLYENATQISEKTALGAAARDLCLNAGEIDDFDFCSELVDTTPMLGIELNCIQKEWRRRGGTPSGEWYPMSVNNIVRQFTKWGDYRKFLDKLFAGLDSSDMVVRADSFKRTMGVKLMNESNIVPAVRYTQPSGCRMTTEVGFNRSGGEDIQVIDTGDYQVCQKACCDNPKCNAFTHVRDSQGGKCFLKRRPTKAVPHHLGPKITSGYKQ